ncbi:MAG TPA: hypothetical protein PK441_01235 [Burkholderiaceae bacterium]|nr:hypothetical protein [Burkholderiaceae bacterium]
MSFEAIEAQVNAAVFGALTNATATYTPGVGDPVVFPVVFDPAGSVINEFGLVTQQPSFTMQPAAFAALATNMVVSLRGVDYAVRSVLPLDEGGWQRVQLAKE